MKNVVRYWFGPDFLRLHPLLQRLHERGGTLRGNVAVRFGTGLAGWIGRRLAARLGIPATPGEIPFTVTISHIEHALYWDRVFDESSPIRSIFTPVGRYPDGHWREDTGLLRMELGVDVRDGAWCWVQKRVRWGKLPIPLWLMPGSSADKRVEDGKYVFRVAFFLPLLGKVLGYGGILDAEPAELISN
jgi:hypothetical protein